MDEAENRDRMRRSTRKRKARYVQYGEHTVLKLNDYSLQDGESSVYANEAKHFADVEVDAPKPLNSYQIWQEEYAKHANIPKAFASRAKILKEAWAKVGEDEKEVYRRKSEKMKRAYERAKERAKSKAKKARQDAEREQQRILKEQNRKSEIKYKEYLKRKRERASQPKKNSKKSKKELRRINHNQKMKQERTEKREARARFMALHKDAIAPFVPENVLKKLPDLSKEEREEMDLLAPDLEAEPTVTQPKSIVYGKMRQYQLKGLEWMLYMYDNNTNMILGDEMGLGKTLQTISILAALKERGVEGPHLVIVPLSVISSWMNEFRKWCPTMRVVRLHSADRAERERLRKSISEDLGTYDVILTTYDLVKVPEMKMSIANRVSWRMVVLDEGHRVKNHESIISKTVKKINSEIILLLTGTPLQNNLRELWALLYYLHPETFVDMTPFESAFELNTADMQIDRKLLEKAHYMLRPLMLRRLKTEVEKMLPPRVETKVLCPLSKMQQFWYKRLLLKNKNMLMRVGEQGGVAKENDGDGKSDWRKLQSLMMQLRKCCNHPFLFPGAEDSMREGASWGSSCDESIIEASGKMENLDRLLVQLKAKGHRVVIFSQFTRFLDIIDDYLRMREWEFARLDGSTNRVQRMVDIQEFNKPNSPYFAFIMSTRAGGLGVNLQTADTVILMDSDWNPQVDMQAMARCHRIGQKKIVHVYRFISAGTMEERVVQRAQKKLFLDSMVNRGSTVQAQKLDKMGSAEVFEALTFGMDRVLEKDDEDAEDPYLTVKDIEELIRRSDPGEKGLDRDENIDQGVDTEEHVKIQPLKRSSSLRSNQKKSAASFEETSPLVALQVFKGIDYSQYKDLTMKSIADDWANISKNSTRKRKSRFENVNGYQVLKQNMYTMNEGEPSVLEKEAAAAKAKTYVAKSGRQVAGRDFDHMAVCQSCWEGGNLLCCDYCPSAYHFGCLGMKESDMKKVKFQWSCPGHSCLVCSRKAAAVGGMLFRCEMCPLAYCEDHLPGVARDRITNRCKRFLKLGQIHPKQSCFMLCSLSCEKHYKASEQGVNTVLAMEHFAKNPPTAEVGKIERRASEVSINDDELPADLTGWIVEKEGGDGELIRGKISKKEKRSYVVEWDDGESSKHGQQKVRHWLVEDGNGADPEESSSSSRVKPEIMDVENGDQQKDVMFDPIILNSMRPTPFERISINCKTPNAAHQKRLALLAETFHKPFALRDIPEFTERCKRVHLATLSRLNGLLFQSTFNKATVYDKLGTWAGVSTVYPDLRPPRPSFRPLNTPFAKPKVTEEDEKVRNEWQERIANVYLDLVRTMTADTSQHGYSKHVLREFCKLLDLKVRCPNGQIKPVHQKCPQRALPEILAMFFTFPAPGDMTLLPEEFVEEDGEEEEEEEPVVEDQKLASYDDLCKAINADLKSEDPPWSKKTLAEELGVGHRQLLKWMKDFKSGAAMNRDCLVAGEMAVRWMIHRRREGWNYCLFYHTSKLSLKKMEDYHDKEFDAERWIGILIRRYERATLIVTSPEVQSLIQDIRLVMLGKNEFKERLWNKLRHGTFKFTLEMKDGEPQVFVSPKKERFVSLIEVQKWFTTTAFDEEDSKESQDRCHTDELQRLMQSHNEDLALIKSKAQSLKAQRELCLQKWTNTLLCKGWRILSCVSVDGQPRVIPSEMAKRLGSKAEKHYVSPCGTLKVKTDEVPKAMSMSRIVSKFSSHFIELHAAKQREQKLAKQREETMKVLQARVALNKVQIRKNLIRKLWELHHWGLKYSTNLYQRGQWAGMIMVTFRGGSVKRSDNYGNILETYLRDRRHSWIPIEKRSMYLASQRRILENQIRSLKRSQPKPKPKSLELVFENRVFKLDPEKTFRIGRKSDCNDLALPSTNVSRKHCIITQNFVTDFNSRNGIRINDKSTKAHLLKPGDRLQIWDYTFEIREAGSFENKIGATTSSTATSEGDKRRMELIQKYEERLSNIELLENSHKENIKKWGKKWRAEVPDEETLFTTIGLRNLDWKVVENKVVAPAPEDSDEEEDEEKDN